MAGILPLKIRQTFTVLPGWLGHSGMLVPHAGMGMWLRQTQPRFFRKPCGRSCKLLCGHARMGQAILTGMV